MEALGLGHIPWPGPTRRCPTHAEHPCPALCQPEAGLAQTPPRAGGPPRHKPGAPRTAPGTSTRVQVHEWLYVHQQYTSTQRFLIPCFRKPLVSPGQPRTCPSPSVPQLPVGLARRRVFMFAPDVSQDKRAGISPSPLLFWRGFWHHPSKVSCSG